MYRQTGSFHRVTVGKSLQPSSPLFAHLYNGHKDSHPSSQVCCQLSPDPQQITGVAESEGSDLTSGFDAAAQHGGTLGSDEGLRAFRGTWSFLSRRREGPRKDQLNVSLRKQLPPLRVVQGAAAVTCQAPEKSGLLVCWFPVAAETSHHKLGDFKWIILYSWSYEVGFLGATPVAC